MRQPGNIVSYHEQRKENSCVTWGIELVLKMHEKLDLNEFPLQDGPGGECWGFGQTERDFVASQYGLITREDRFELAEFKQVARNEAGRGYPLIFSLLNPSGKMHVWVAYLENQALTYRSRRHSSSAPLTENDLNLLDWYNVERNKNPNYKIHCLLHSPCDDATT